MAKHIFLKRNKCNLLIWGHQKHSVRKIYDIPQKDRLRGNKGRLPKAKEIAETDEGDGSGPAQLEGSPSSYNRNEQLSRAILTEV